MIPTWVIPILSEHRKEVLFKGKYIVRINGVKTGGEYIVDIYVNALPYFAWGVNGFHTGVSDFKGVVRYYFMDVINQLSMCGAEGKDELLNFARNFS